MKVNRKIVLSSIIAGISLWVIDALVDSYFFASNSSFLDSLIFEVSPHELYFRTFFIAGFVLFGIVISRIVSRQKILKELLIQAKNDWEETFDSITDIITIHDKDFNIIRANIEAMKTLSLPFIKNISNEKCFEFYHGKSSAPEKCPSCASIKTGKPDIYETFEPHLNKFIEIRTMPRLDKNKNFTGLIHVVRDITRRKEMEQQLEAAIMKAEGEKAKTEAIIAGMGDGIIIQDADYRIVYQNQIQTEIYGNHDGEYCYKVYEGRDSICEDCPVELTFRDGKIHKTEKVVTTDNGTMYFELTSSPLRDATGKIIAGIKVIRNITEQKLIEVALKKSEERYRLFIDSAVDISFFKDENLRYLIANKACSLFFGKKEDEIMGKTDFELMPESAAAVCRQTDIKAIQSEGFFASEEVICDRVFETRKFRVRIADDKFGVGAYIRDITEKKLAEEELKERMQLAELNAEVALSLAKSIALQNALQRCAESLVKYLDASFARIWTFNIEENVLELQCSAGIYTHTNGFHSRIPFGQYKIGMIAKNLSPHLTNNILDDPLVHNQEWVRKEGMTAFAGHPLVVENRLVGVMAVFSRKPLSATAVKALASIADVIAIGIERKRAEDELERHGSQLVEIVEERTFELKRTNERLLKEIEERKRAETEAVRASQLAAIGELAAGVAHEINNPVNGILNYAEILANKNTPGSTESDIANRIIKESERIATIVRNLLSFARDSKEERHPVGVNEIISSTLSLTEAQLRKDGIVLMINIPNDLPQVIAQPQQIEQVFLNIISNARYSLNQKYGGAHDDKMLKIMGEAISDDDNPCVRIMFYDKGTGIPAGILDKVMNPFFTTKPGNLGTGLGLSISHSIINNHGGKIIITSSEGDFTNVIIELPACKQNNLVQQLRK
ncbi:MAG: PAS domain-containing protein [Nitrospirae bacterium]|nr:PAS domain-containing protein [Nitrospirota bacterium]